MFTFRILKNTIRVEKTYKVGNCQHKLIKGLKRFYMERWMASPLGPEQPRLPRWMPLLSFFCAAKTVSEIDLWWHCHWLKLPPLHWSPRVSEFGLWLTLRSLAAVCLRPGCLTWRRESTEMQTLQNPASINSYDFASAKVWISSCLLSYKGKCVVFVLRPPCGSVYLIRDVNTSLFPSHNITPASFSLLSKHLMVMQIKWAPLLSFEPSDADACSGLLVANQGSPQISWC